MFRFCLNYVVTSKQRKVRYDYCAIFLKRINQCFLSDNYVLVREFLRSGPFYGFWLQCSGTGTINGTHERRQNRQNSSKLDRSVSLLQFFWINIHVYNFELIKVIWYSKSLSENAKDSKVPYSCVTVIESSTVQCFFFRIVCIVLVKFKSAP